MTLRRQLSFAAVGIVNTAVDFATFGAMLVWVTNSVIFANITAWTVSFVGAYILNATFTFKVGMTLWRLATFFASSLVTLSISTTCVALLAGEIGAWGAKVLAIGISYAVGFTLARNFAFR